MASHQEEDFVASSQVVDHQEQDHQEEDHQVEDHQVDHLAMEDCPQLEFHGTLKEKTS